MWKPITNKSHKKQDDTTIGYFGQLCQCSNFFHSKFEINNLTFKTSKHHIHYTKATYFSDTHTARAILECETPQETKELVRTIPNFDHQKWIQNGLELVRPGIKVTFDQNLLLMKTLKATKPKILVEATINSTWGTGVPLTNPNALDKSVWKNCGWMCDILMTIRDNN